ncbi:GNAT family N-acetyltransferase [Curtobacterium sp. MCPF17_047]|uniref:GNAT family N-acetyltransferase n=1 Tax=Curtobacterium sp. MCPF17_047 TaxID=2175654 RepID=UPI000DA9F610|nr:GNAT family N-acetyltransferase [Curtobacterium sp. MCPF17_047]PZF64158.1 GNAT family N-acetyltransferase [Curtobacterium sp. MCPF17_047]
MSEDIRWEVVEESALSLTDHEAIAAMLAQAFPSWSHWYVGGRSWAGMQPERRVLGRTEDGVVLAHVGIRRMFVTVGGEDVLVGDTGLVGVSPRLQGSGVGRELMERVHDVLDGLRVPYGFLGAGEDRIPFYDHMGWHEFPEAVGTFSAFTADGAGVVETEQGGWMVRPVTARLEDWPEGPILLNGQQV